MKNKTNLFLALYGLRSKYSEDNLRKYHQTNILLDPRSVIRTPGSRKTEVDNKFSIFYNRKLKNLKN
jgi:hypothetical protein